MKALLTLNKSSQDARHLKQWIFSAALEISECQQREFEKIMEIGHEISN